MTPSLLRPVWAFCSLNLLLVVGSVAVAQPDPDSAVGLAVGQSAPKFTLPDQSGQEQSLDGLLKAGPVALVFYRSADW